MKFERIANQIHPGVIGEKIWLEYFDQNFRFEETFVPQYCTVVSQYAEIGGANDWFLVALDAPVEYEGATFENLMIRSRWVDGMVGSDQPTAVFIVLVPKSCEISHSLELDRSLYVAWGFSARTKESIIR